MLEYDETNEEWWKQWFEECWNVKLHKNARKLITGLNIWNGENGIELGVDEDDEIFSIMSEEFRQDNNVSFYQVLSNLEFMSRSFTDFWITDKEEVLEIENLYKQRMSNSDYYSTYTSYFDTDKTLYHFALGQLMMQGFIEPKMKEIAIISMKRQIKIFQRGNDIILKVLDIIEQAPNQRGQLI